MREETLDRLDLHPRVHQTLEGLIKRLPAATKKRIDRLILYGDHINNNESTDPVDLFIVWTGPREEAEAQISPLASVSLEETGIRLVIHLLSPDYLVEIRETDSALHQDLEQNAVLLHP